MTDIEYRVRPGDTFASIARRFGIDAWEDLWRHNAAALEAAGVRTPDLLGEQGRDLVVRVPDDRDHALARQLLAARGVLVERYLGGTSWLDPRGLVSTTLLTTSGAPVPDGTRVLIHDPVLERTYEDVVKDGHVTRRLPRKGFQMRILAFPGFEERYGWFRRVVGPGDELAAVKGEVGGPRAPRPRQERAQDLTAIDFTRPTVVERAPEVSAGEEVDDDDPPIVRGGRPGAQERPA